jgi:glycosyltransferase involved in cell wall biosynthesis
VRYGASSKNIDLLNRVLKVAPHSNDEISKGVGIDEAAIRSIIIKWPQLEESIIRKGVIVVTFTRTFSYYLSCIDLQGLDKYFYIVLEPSWSGYADPDIMAFRGRIDQVVVQASEIEDRILLNSMPDSFVPVCFGASDWVDARLFNQIDIERKIYDSIYIANTNPVKRVKRYLDAIRNIVKTGHSDYVGCLVCAAWGGAQLQIEEMVRKYNLQKNIVTKFSLSRDQVIEALNLSKVNVLLSYKEGSNRSLFEALFCGTPVICIAENVGVNKSYINEYTGLLVADGSLEDALIWTAKHYTRFAPRDWVVQNISPVVTTAKLCSVLQKRLDGGSSIKLEEFLVKTNNPEVSYYDYPGLNHKKYSLELLTLFDKPLADADRQNRIEELKIDFYNHIAR